MTETVAAVDLGATSGRVILGHVSSREVGLTEINRFENVPVSTPDGLHWNLLALYQRVVEGLVEAGHRERLRSVAVDSWAVDYALLRDGRMLAQPYHYRDARTAPAIERTHQQVPFDRLYQASGLQFLPFNTVYQLVAEREAGLLDVADQLLLIPDLLGRLLAGTAVTERTNASTTGLIDIVGGEWNGRLMRELSIPEHLFTPLVDPGVAIGTLRPELEVPGQPELFTVGSHDTASAVVAVPAADEEFAYISSGTWSLVGLELERPVVTPASRTANFTNELGLDNRIRFLRNASGLWLFDQTLHAWRARGEHVDQADLLEEAAAIPADAVTGFDAGDPRFIAAGDMPGRIRDWYLEHDRRAPQGRAQFIRAIMESLAEGYAASIRQAVELTGKTVRTVHIVGGGSRNRLLCQLTADRTGLPVLAGPAEATALGNVLIQARAHGVISGPLEALRALVSASFTPTRYEPGVGGRRPG